MTAPMRACVWWMPRKGANGHKGHCTTSTSIDTKENSSMTASPKADLERHLERARPRLLALATGLASLADALDDEA